MYEILISPAAEKDYKKIPAKEIERINNTIDSLAGNPRPAGYKKLKGRNAYRVRTGNYRIIYEIEEKSLHVFVIRIRDRKEVYRNLPR